MRRFLLQGITEKPAIAIVCADFFRCPPQRGKAVQMLDQHHLDQHHRVNAGAPIILTIKRLHHFIQLCEVHRCIYLSQQMLLRHQLVYDYELYQISIHFPAFQRLSSPLPALPYLYRKSPAPAALFRQTERGKGNLSPSVFQRLSSVKLTVGYAMILNNRFQPNFAVFCCEYNFGRL